MNELNFCVTCPYAIECSNGNYIVCPKAYFDSIAQDETVETIDTSDDIDMSDCPFV